MLWVTLLLFYSSVVLDRGHASHGTPAVSPTIPRKREKGKGKRLQGLHTANLPAQSVTAV